MTTQTISPNLLSSFQLGNITLKNRVAMAPMTRARAGEKRLPNSLMAEYYTQRASAGLIITEATVISEQANGWQQTPGIYTDEQVKGWQLVTNAVHEKGTAIFMQMWHCGRSSHSSFHPNGELPVAPSAIKLNGDYIHTPKGKQDYETPRALETEEIKQIIQDYCKAAQRAKLAGFDGVEIHAANGYLIDEFLQSKTNHRTDEYGGSLENRYRFLREIVEGVTQIWGANRVAVRLSPNGVYNDMGSSDYRETFLYVAQQLNQYQLAYLHVMDGLAFGFHELGEPMTLPEFSQVFHGTLMGNCGYTQETAEEAIVNGNADLIAFGRPYITNPDLVERFANNWELSPPAPPTVWSSFTKEGYTDFPNYQNA